MTTKKSIEEQPAHPVPVLSRHPQQPFSKSATRFPNLRRVFQICDAFSKSAMRFPNLRCVFQICDAFSKSAMRFPNLRCVFQICDAFSKSAMRFPNLRCVFQICDADLENETSAEDLKLQRPFEMFNDFVESSAELFNFQLLTIGWSVARNVAKPP